VPSIDVARVLFDELQFAGFQVEAVRIEVALVPVIDRDDGLLGPTARKIDHLGSGARHGRQINRLGVRMKRIGAEKMEVFIALPILLEQHVAAVARPGEMHDPALRVMSDRPGRVQASGDINDPDVHAVSLRCQKGELPPVRRDRCATDLRIIEKILERNPRSGLSCCERRGSEDQEEKGSESKPSPVHHESCCLTKWSEGSFNI
jgi:hypothetical protein